MWVCLTGTSDAVQALDESSCFNSLNYAQLVPQLALVPHHHLLPWCTQCFQGSRGAGGCRACQSRFESGRQGTRDNRGFLREGRIPLDVPGPLHSARAKVCQGLARPQPISLEIDKRAGEPPRTPISTASIRRLDVPREIRPSVGMALSEARIAALTKLFEKLDKNSDGVVQFEEFQTLGEAMLGKRPSEEDARKQLDRADTDKDGVLSLAEWLAYSTMLAKLPEDKFEACIKSYTEKVERLNAQK